MLFRSVGDDTTGSVEGTTSSVERISIDVVFVDVEMTTRELITLMVGTDVVVELWGSGLNVYVSVTDVVL